MRGDGHRCDDHHCGGRGGRGGAAGAFGRQGGKSSKARKNRLAKRHEYEELKAPTIGGVSEEVAREALRLASHKLPCKTKFVARETKIGGEE